MKAFKGAVKVNISKYSVHRSSYSRQYITFFVILIKFRFLDELEDV